jgi:hypothetical protein
VSKRERERGVKVECGGETSESGVYRSRKERERGRYSVEAKEREVGIASKLERERWVQRRSEKERGVKVECGEGETSESGVYRSRKEREVGTVSKRERERKREE